MQNRKEAFYLVSIIALLSLIIFLQAQNRFLKNSDQRMRLAMTGSYNVYTLNGELKTIFDNFQSLYILLIYFSSNDCPACLDEYSVWNSLADFYPDDRLEVIGIIDKSDVDKLFMSGLVDSLEFQVYVDNGELRKILPVVGTPAKLLFNSARTLQFVDWANPDTYSQKMFEQAIKSIVGIPLDNTRF